MFRGGRNGTVLVLLSLGLGCSSDAEPTLDLLVASGCEGETYAACAASDIGCQRQIFSGVACLRAMPDALLPEIRSITAAQYQAELEASLTEPVDEPAPISGYERTLALLGLAMTGELAPASFVSLYVETVPGYYSSRDDQVTIIEPAAGELIDVEQEVLLLAHEFAHALQDQDVDLDSLRPDDQTFDQYLAVTSVIEGEAAMLDSFYEAAMWGLRGAPDFRSHFVSWVERAEERYGDQSPLTVGPRYFPYSYGARYVYNVYARGGNAAVRDLYANLPQSVLPMLLSVDDVVAPELDSLSSLVLPDAPEGYTQTIDETLGPWVFSRFLERSIGSGVAFELETHWRGDRFLVYEAEAGVVSGVWMLRFDDVAAAVRFADVLEERPSGSLPAAMFALRSERDVALGVMAEPSAAGQWQAAVEAAQATPTASPPRQAGRSLDVETSGTRRLSAAAKRRLLEALR